MTRFFVNDTEEDADQDFDDQPDLEKNWRWVAVLAGVVLVGAVAGTVMILGGGDSGSTAGKVMPQTSLPVAAPGPPAASITPTSTSQPPVSSSLPPETVTSVTPSTSPTSQTPSAAAGPTVDARAVTYTVSGSRSLIDLVTVFYTDEQGALQTDVNVALPWSRTVVLNPGVQLSSVTATSVTGHLNCSITDASGATLALQNKNSMIATCTR
jgi:Mycobacterium membrane protein